jgi:hypothetical protein
MNNIDKLLQELIAESNNIKAQIEKGGLGNAILNRLKESSNELQQLINKIIAKDKNITLNEYNEAYEKLRQSKENQLKNELNKTKLFFVIVGGVGVLALSFYIYKKIKK